MSMIYCVISRSKISIYVLIAIFKQLLKHISMINRILKSLYILVMSVFVKYHWLKNIVIENKSIFILKEKVKQEYSIRKSE